MKENIEKVSKAKAKAEVWRDVPGYEGYYQVSNTGIVRSLDRTVLSKNGHERFYKGRFFEGSDVNGYKQIILSRDSKQELFYTHQLVAMVFLDHKPNGHTLVVDHIDGDRTNNNVDNLRIVTNRENSSICFKKNRDSFTSEYVGVRQDKDKWRAQIRFNNKVIHLGYFDIELKASKAYQSALGKIKDGTFNPEDYKPKYVSKYKGVSFNKSNQKWLSRLTINGKRTYLGSFATEEEAYQAIQNNNN